MMTAAGWAELHAAQRILAQPDRHSRAELDYARERCVVLAEHAGSELAADLRALGELFGSALQRLFADLAPGIQRFYDAAVEAGLIAPAEAERVEEAPATHPCPACGGTMEYAADVEVWHCRDCGDGWDLLRDAREYKAEQEAGA